MYPKETTSTGWFDAFVNWLGMHGYLKPKTYSGQTRTDDRRIYHPLPCQLRCAASQGLTGDQRIFLGWAQVWRSLTRDAALKQQLATDPHSRRRVHPAATWTPTRSPDPHPLLRLDVVLVPRHACRTAGSCRAVNVPGRAHSTYG